MKDQNRLLLKLTLTLPTSKTGGSKQIVDGTLNTCIKLDCVLSRCMGVCCRSQCPSRGFQSCVLRSAADNEHRLILRCHLLYDFDAWGPYTFLLLFLFSFSSPRFLHLFICYCFIEFLKSLSSMGYVSRFRSSASRSGAWLES
jgi:hypothetical protein